MEYLTAFGNWCGGPGFWHNGSNGLGGWMPFHFGGIFQILIFGLIIYFVFRLFRAQSPSTATPSPHDVIKRRYAAGEIDKETFDRMKDELK